MSCSVFIYALSSLYSALKSIPLQNEEHCMINVLCCAGTRNEEQNWPKRGETDPSESETKRMCDTQSANKKPGKTHLLIWVYARFEVRPEQREEMRAFPSWILQLVNSKIIYYNAFTLWTNTRILYTEECRLEYIFCAVYFSCTLCMYFCTYSIYRL